MSSLKLVTSLLKGNKLGVVVKGPTESSKYRLTQALASFIAVDNARALVTVGELAQFKGCRVLPPNVH